MRILLYRGDGNTGPWADDFQRQLPGVQCVAWTEGAKLAPCDYAVVWAPPKAMLRELAEVKAVFLMGAGADAILKHATALPAHVPIVRLGDAGMGVQMGEYVAHAVLRYFRRFDQYEDQAAVGEWRPLEPHDRASFTVGVMGAGVLGRRVLDCLRPFGFPLQAWSRTEKHIDGVRCHAGEAGLDDFLRSTRVLVCMLPLTDETSNILNRANMGKLPQGAYLINVARGAHVSEPDLLAYIKSGHIAGATLDVFRNEPLPLQHPFWQEPRITITPHIAALTLREESVRQIAGKIGQLERGEAIADVIDRELGY
ncbi:glyoxylate/hydroxypyruvate reductase A [Pseudoduganella flava]|uniref:Glyoxylate/hydroxypyruvate reductase A n=1 Tax=Pseudoduganella flava TaxID=871742 RepID=A0A562PGB5_9BURK|nr:glyoxylate/hydroxypyruvate reductase A [Pseudoduganella flava]QGZ40306.1 glyoxylate/hydroxypyruvate reductase A [Pseudoduganella flava]TWI43494.1 glyoxylate/hydroxypyruvate reductase A [Pseudoduganella flava]